MTKRHVSITSVLLAGMICSPQAGAWDGDARRIAAKPYPQVTARQWLDGIERHLRCDRARWAKTPPAAYAYAPADTPSHAALQALIDELQARNSVLENDALDNKE